MLHATIGVMAASAILLLVSRIRWQHLQSSYLWPVGGIGAMGGALFTWSIARPLRHALDDDRQRRTVLLLPTACGALIATLLFWSLNAGGDFSIAQRVSTRIYDRGISGGRYREHWVIVGSGRAHPDRYRIEVNPARFQALPQDIPVILTWHRGLLGVPWCGRDCITVDPSRGIEP